VLERRLEFGKQATCEIAGSATNALVAVPLAFTGFGVWSLVAGQLASQLVRAVSLVRLSGWRPRLRFSATLGREFFGYGKFLWVFAILSVVGDSLDRMIVGRWLGAATLGAYSLAYGLARFVPTFVTRIVGRVSFPAFARLQTDRATLRAAFLKALSHISVATVPLAFGMLAVSEELILVLYGEPWREAVPVVEVLAFYGMALSVSSVAGPVFRAIGHPQLLLQTSLLHHSLLVALLLVLGRYGAVGIAQAVVVPMLVSSAISFWLVGAHLELRPRALLEPLLRCAVPSVAMYLVLRGAKAWLDTSFELAPPATLGILVALGMLVYLGASVLVNRSVLIEFSTTVRQVLFARGDLV
jgi:O-antigen/teichoic acid export membrane protein